jgi:hypothetical protein
MAVKYFDRDDAKIAKLRTERGIGFEEIVFHIDRGDLSTFWNTRIPTVAPASAASSSGARTTCTWCRSRFRPPPCSAGYSEVTPYLSAFTT